MQKIRIMTDTAGDIPQETADALGIRVMPIPITHEGRNYLERVDMTNEEFYELLLSSREIPCTSHITADTYLKEYKKIYQEGCSHLINITINSLGSNMFDAASLAARMFYEEMNIPREAFHIAVVDSKTYTMAYGIAAIKAAQMARGGIRFEEIMEYLQDWFDRLEILFSVYSLDFAKKSGRIGCAAAFVGEMLGLRPMMCFVDGVASIVDKVRGDKNVVPRMVEVARMRAKDADKYPFLIIRGTPVAEAEQLKALVNEKMPEIKLEGVFSVGASIAINSGPKVVALVYAGKKRIK